MPKAVCVIILLIILILTCWGSPFKIKQEHFETTIKLESGTNNAVITSKDGLLGEFPFPKGTILMFWDDETKIPTGWVPCDGRKVGDYQVPDLRGRFPIGQNTNLSTLTKRNVNDKGGEEKTKLTLKQIPSHDHKYYTGQPTTIYDPCSNPTVGRVPWSRQVGLTSDPEGGDVGHDNMPPYTVVSFIIKL